MESEGSGRARCHKKGNIEDDPILDIRILRRRGWLVRGKSISIGISWHWHLKRQNLLQAHIVTDMRDPAQSHVIIAYAVGDKILWQNIAVIWRPTPFKGARPFFSCPVSGRPCEVLVLGSHGFASRAANGLAYRTQSQGRLDRMVTAKLKLHWRLWPLEGHKHAPRGRHRERLEERYWNLELAIDRALGL